MGRMSDWDDLRGARGRTTLSPASVAVLQRVRQLPGTSQRRASTSSQR